MARGYKKKTAIGRRSRSIRRAAQSAGRYSRVSRNRSRRSYHSRAWYRNSLLGRNVLAMQRCSTVLRYNQVISLDPKSTQLGATGSNVWQFSANSCYDPDVSGAGHQPLYYDNYANVFKRYHVKYSTITVTVVNHFVNTATSNSTGTVTTQPNYSYKLFIIKDPTSGATGEYPSYMEQVLELGGSSVKWRFVSPSLTGRLPRLKMGCSPHKLAQKAFGDDTMQSLVSSGPTSNIYYYVGITSADGNTDPPSVYLNIDIKYYVDFFDREIIQSQN